MSRLRAILGLVAGAMLLLSAGAHSFVGWPAMRGQLQTAGAPESLVKGMQVGWQFGGACMVAFACIVLSTFVARIKGRPAATTHALFIGIAYCAFGAWALAANEFAPFYWIFVVPGILLVLASTGQANERSA